MAREFLISCYLAGIWCLFHLFRLWPLRAEKVCFVLSFNDTADRVWDKLDERYTKIIIENERPIDYPREETGFHLFRLQPKRPLQFIQSLYHLATSKVIIIDNYFGFLSVTNFKAGARVVQLWHANGAIKKFGLQDPAIARRSSKARKRFQRVYDRFDQVVVGSDKMMAIFQESFGLESSHFLKTGIPRTDFFFDQQEIDQRQAELLRQYPMINGRKVILYAPTFREDQLHAPDLALDVDRMAKTLSEEYVLLVRLHPAVSQQTAISAGDFVLDVSAYPNVNHLLTVTDILITDYSSIPFEFALLERPMIFFPYDLETYERERGFWEPYIEQMPGPVVFTSDELMQVIQEQDFDLEQVRRFCQEWNPYTDGMAADRLTDSIEKAP